MAPRRHADFLPDPACPNDYFPNRAGGELHAGHPGLHLELVADGLADDDHQVH